ncbi:hypothetical protein AKJ66_04375 [candidate division MSBL1 archaeon SCGC-AAA259E22]|uniref:Uncharacterized protein n=1 Tax=candidate division MSBL1 archaeon SCGC-AAA259E22 TaxID=1698265 RepID=A0A133UDM1_9EURY|nr:hypothetical protein AKJ66_04375 [candidate division MSBL1 archaeon SCGC-AAA259E22]
MRTKSVIADAFFRYPTGFLLESFYPYENKRWFRSVIFDSMNAEDVTKDSGGTSDETDFFRYRISPESPLASALG